jgi:hypothetical protein
MPKTKPETEATGDDRRGARRSGAGASGSRRARRARRRRARRAVVLVSGPPPFADDRAARRRVHQRAQAEGRLHRGAQRSAVDDRVSDRLERPGRRSRSTPASATTRFPSIRWPAGGNRKSVWYPLVSYSPEYIAMQSAKQVGARTVFMDLPHYAEPGPRSRAAGAGREAQADPAARSRRHRAAEFVLPAARQGGRLPKLGRDVGPAVRSPAAGVVVRGIRREVALFCAAVRATTPPESLEHDGTLPRERFMWRTIQRPWRR